MDAGINTKKFGSSIKNQVIKFFKTNNFELGEIVVDGEGIHIPLPKTEKDYKKLSRFILNLPQEIYEKHPDEIKGSIMIIDEFQAIKDLWENLDAFLWLIRNVVQNQKRVAYIFSGSMSTRDSIIEKTAGKSGAFGGRMLNIDIYPFTDETVRSYLEEKLPSLILDDSGFRRFYNCTNGVPYYVNTLLNYFLKMSL